MSDYEALLTEWFGPKVGENERPSGHTRWFRGGAAFDEELRAKFGELPERAERGELDGWAVTARGALALVLVLDQLPRNLYRDTARSFAFDARARAVAKAALASGFDAEVDPVWRAFFYLPFEHSENMADQETAVDKTRAAAESTKGPAREMLEDYTDYALRHLRIIERFGRFPHRNALLGRAMTPEEAAFLKEPGSSF